ncbi:MAG: peroxide stress protein YaaA [Micrococcaceae bacterium]
MIILLPPSETKNAATTKGKPVNFDNLSFPELKAARTEVLTNLIKVSKQKNALAVLSVGKSIAPEVERNTHLLEEPAQPAHQVYNGVLYDALDYNSLTSAQREKAHKSVLVQSALWGLISLTDKIPAYRLSMSVKLSRLGNLTTWWKKHLELPFSDDEIFVDCRSGTYQNAYPTPVEKTVLIKPLGIVNGKKKVITHMAKQTRGLVTRELLQSRKQVKTIKDIANILGKKWQVELIEPKGKNPWVLEVI